VNAADVLKYGHRDLLARYEGLSPEQWTRVGVTTSWSIQDLAAHLASYECLLEDALISVAGEAKPTPTLDAMKRDHQGFNEAEVAARRSRSPEQIVREYTEAHERVIALAARLGPAKLAEVGTIPWYGASYSLDDLIVYANYGHKREHGAQIKSFRKSIGA
jgi:hypothetical protein